MKRGKNRGGRDRVATNGLAGRRLPPAAPTTCLWPATLPREVKEPSPTVGRIVSWL
jgi:hypothetical protein